MSYNKFSILYVEDEQEIRDNLSKFLNRLCDVLHIAEDGEKGLALYTEHLPDVVISDIKMPKMNGIEMTKAIKEINPKQYIIFTTAHSESGFFMEAIEAQVDGYILKPVILKTLKYKIESLKEQITLKRNFKNWQILMSEISEMQDNMLVVLDGSLTPIFSNNKFLKFLHVDGIDKLKSNNINISSLFIEHDDFFFPKIGDDKDSWITQMKYLQDNERIVSMLEGSTPKAFLVSIKFIATSLHTVVTFTEITHIAIEKKELENKAFWDELTGTYNRSFFNEELKKEIANFKRTVSKLSCIMFDIDLFKNFNDTYGHQTGDDVLLGISKLVKTKVRKTDTLARWGGEEFIIILPNTSLEKAKNVAEILRSAIEKHSCKDDLKVTCSFGVAEIEENDDSKSLIAKVDKALYKAKELGRNRVESYV